MFKYVECNNRIEALPICLLGKFRHGREHNIVREAHSALHVVKCCRLDICRDDPLSKAGHDIRHHSAAAAEVEHAFGGSLRQVPLRGRQSPPKNAINEGIAMCVCWKSGFIEREGLLPNRRLEYLLKELLRLLRSQLIPLCSLHVS